MSWNQPSSSHTSLNSKDKTKQATAKYHNAETTCIVKEVNIRESSQKMQRARTTIVKSSTSKATAMMVYIALTVMMQGHFKRS